jgi:dipeptide/tripeptide permease
LGECGESVIVVRFSAVHNDSPPRIFSGSPWLFAQVAVAELRAESIGELLIMPIGYAMIGKLAPRQYQGVMMGSWMLVTGLASLFAGDFSGMIPEATGTTAIATNPGYAKLFAELGVGSLAVGIVLVVLIPFLRKLITDKAETAPAVAPTPAASAFVRSRSDVQSGSRWIAHTICSLPLLMPSK